MGNRFNLYMVILAGVVLTVLVVASLVSGVV